MFLSLASGAIATGCERLSLIATLSPSEVITVGLQFLRHLFWLPAGPLIGMGLATWQTRLRVPVERSGRNPWARHALIVGAGEDGQLLARHLDEHKQLGYIFKGYVDPHHHADPRLLGRPDELAQIVTKHFIDDVFIAMRSEPSMIDSIVLEARKARCNVKLMQQFAVGVPENDAYEFIGTLPAVALHDEPIPRIALAFKRVIDLVLGSILLVLTAPLMLLCALAVKLDSPGPAVYRAKRIGKKGRKFVCYKFRTMVENADEMKDMLLPLNERDGLFFKIAQDPRLTKTGPFLRKYSLDELPQLWSVIKGDMSLIGPRPPSIDEYELYGPEHLRRLRVTPGLSGLWQVTARKDPSFETYLALDLEYIEKWSFWLDLKILSKTVPAVLRGGGL